MRSDEHEVRVQVSDDDAITAMVTEPRTGEISDWTLIYAPGAGSNVHDPFGRFACRRLAHVGVRCVRFQFPFQERGQRAPDRPSVLEAAWTAVANELRPAEGRMVVGGRSMGGRIASQAVAKGLEANAMVLFAYPLHPPGKPERRRDEHLPLIRMPVWFCSGTRDAFAKPHEIQGAAALVAEASVHILDGADHGFNVTKASGRSRDDVYEEAIEAFHTWLNALDLTNSANDQPRHGRTVL